jgi:hypothetical protein
MHCCNKILQAECTWEGLLKKSLVSLSLRDLCISVRYKITFLTCTTNIQSNQLDVEHATPLHAEEDMHRELFNLESACPQDDTANTILYYDMAAIMCFRELCSRVLSQTNDSFNFQLQQMNCEHFTSHTTAVHLYFQTFLLCIQPHHGTPGQWLQGLPQDPQKQSRPLCP